ncbi:hypothetical protein [Ralstonia mannitolilytica]|uniref:hypothetical protein n=1 Tax=Ralstonia mannitolilytica TaxID=105219 RepID=UPI0026EE591A|nr:hypothetical protein [Ralstonia mannitolilytica]
MSHSPMNQLLGEQLIDVRQAALMFNLPSYWLSQAKERKARRIPPLPRRQARAVQAC